MSQRAKFHHRHHGRHLKERCRQIGCGGELRELRLGFSYPEHVEGTRAAKRAGLHGAPVKIGLLGSCSKCGTHVNIRTIFGMSIEPSAPLEVDEATIETVTADEQAELLAAYQEEAVA